MLVDTEIPSSAFRLKLMSEVEAGTVPSILYVDPDTRDAVNVPGSPGKVYVQTSAFSLHNILSSL